MGETSHESFFIKSILPVSVKLQYIHQSPVFDVLLACSLFMSLFSSIQTLFPEKVPDISGLCEWDLDDTSIL